MNGGKPSLDRTARLIGYNPQIGLREGLERTWLWLQERVAADSAVLQGGDVSRFRKLAELMGAGHGVQGVLLPDFSRPSEIPRSMEELAAFAIAEMQRVQPEGPYFLAGYSFGGSLAYEIAQQITASGEQVALLALWDADLNAQKIRASISRFLLRARGVASWPLRKRLFRYSVTV